MNSDSPVEEEEEPIEVETSQARTHLRCTYCWTRINPGELYKHYCSDGVDVRMHPECHRASLSPLHVDPELPTPGTFRRGCACGERKEFCECDFVKGTKNDE